MVVINVGFEKPEHFNYGEGTIWDAHPGLPDPTKLFTLETDIVHRGLASARVALTDTSVDYRRRLHLEHIWDPILDRHLWLTTWIYMPLDQRVEEWLNIHRSIEERWHVKGYPWVAGPYVNWWQLTCGLNRRERVAADEYYVRSGLNHGWVDNDGDGVNDLPRWEMVKSKDTFKFGQWNKITTYVFRDMEHGVYKMWLNDLLQWHVRDKRTIGILPERLATTDPTIEAWICSGIALYTQIGSSPKEAYFDDVTLSNEPTLIPPALRFAGGSIAGGIAGAIITRNPIGAIVGATLGGLISTLTLPPPPHRATCVRCGKSFKVTNLGERVGCPYCRTEQVAKLKRRG